MTAIEQVIQKAIAFDHGDARRIHHFLKVYAYADTIGRLEGLPVDQQDILRTLPSSTISASTQPKKNTVPRRANTRKSKAPLRPGPSWKNSVPMKSSSTGSASSSPTITPTTVSTAWTTRYSWKPISWSTPMKTS